MRNWITNDLGWKLFSIILAAVIWLTVHKILGGSETPAALVVGEKMATYDDLQVLVVSSAADVHDFRVDPKTVTVTVSGAPAIMARLQGSQIRAEVNLTDIESTKEEHRRVDVYTPPGVTLISVQPPTVDVIVPPAGKQP